MQRHFHPPLLFLGTVLLIMTFNTPASGSDWFVRAGSNGDGTKQKPFGDPWEALERCEAGDIIHITEGRYLGKLGSGEWKIPFDGVQLLGGYSQDFSERDPWRLRTELTYDRSSKNRPKEARILSSAAGNVIDGLVLDMQDQNEYEDEQRSGRKPDDLAIGQPAIYLWKPATVRNCVFLNTGHEAIVCRQATVIENNLFLNVFDCAVKVLSVATGHEDAKKPAIIDGNTFAWSWCDRAPGKGRYSGAGVHLTGIATIKRNIFVNCDNNAVFCTADASRTSIENNVFFMNLWSNVKLSQDAIDIVIDDQTMDLLEECGLKAFEGNEVLNPEMSFDPSWLDSVAKRTASQPGKVVMDDWNQLRQALGLDLTGTGGKAASGVSPAYPAASVMALLEPKNKSVTVGARRKALEVKLSEITASAPTKSFETKELLAWASQPDQVDGRALEMVVAISGVANISGIPAIYDKEQHSGIFLHDAGGKERVTGFFKKGTTSERIVNDGMGHYSGSGPASRLYTVRGVAHVSTSYPKAAFFIESIAPFEAVAAARKRAQGVDWFVRAGSTGGNGSQEKPFKDPFQALEKCQAGDTIHVAGGEYVGKLRCGRWKIEVPDIALLGGYDSTFQVRNPWKSPTLLFCPEDFKGTRGGFTIEGDADHTGLIIDGFVFDKRLNNIYAENGDLIRMGSDQSEHIWITRPACEIRNCIFLNGAIGAIHVANGDVIENNIFINHYSQTIVVVEGHTTDPAILRNNTIAFSWDKLFGDGHGRTGEAIALGGRVRAVVESNILQFSDNNGIRLDADPKDIELVDNVFGQNLFCNVYRTAGTVFVDDSVFGQLEDLGFRKCSGNQLLMPNLPLDQAWFDRYLGRTAYVKGKVEMDEWNQVRELLGQPLIATGAKLPEGMAPAYDRSSALALFPRNEACRAGARPKDLPVSFTGILRGGDGDSAEYLPIHWEAVRDSGAWDQLAGQRVMLIVSVGGEDNQWRLSGVEKETHSAWKVSGPQGIDSGGLPVRV
ncbi:MAG: right-handed parallel beta-helix repeat-containing protein, partial [Planctomycetota bacterium]